MHRPQVYPALPRAWRDADTVQWGLPGQPGVALTGLTPGDVAVLDALDGTHDVPALLQVADAHGLPGARVHQLLRLLDQAGVLVDAPDRPSTRADRADLSQLTGPDPGPDPGRRGVVDRRGADSWALAYGTTDDGLGLLLARGRRRVAIEGPDPARPGHAGPDPLVAGIASTVTAAGIGTVTAPDAEATGPAASAPGAPDLVVLVRDDVVDVRRGDALVDDGQDHLPVVRSGDRVTVGPLVTPGRGPCLRCLDLHRRDRDPAWPQLAAQLSRTPSGRPGRAAARGEPACTAVAAGLAALQVLVHLDGQVRPVSHGCTLEVLLPQGLVERRRWSAHPGCGCVLLATGSPDGPALRERRA